MLQSNTKHLNSCTYVTCSVCNHHESHQIQKHSHEEDIYQECSHLWLACYVTVLEIPTHNERLHDIHV